MDFSLDFYGLPLLSNGLQVPGFHLAGRRFHQVWLQTKPGPFHVFRDFP